MIIALKVLLYIVSITSSILLIGIIMIQQNKSGGGLGAVSGGVTEQMFGTSAGNILTKTTTWLAVIFLISTLLLGTVIGRLEKMNTSVAETLVEEQGTTVAPATTETKTEPAAAETKTEAAAPAAPAATEKKEAPAAPAGK
ncbi:MAG: preprotein translocase subunit SecG [Victivallales bacterium]|nr:preprotein translocase subunit SecG [Victivallales bacterium]